jgi:photosystem II stability/assembly factor-like uncharacterized protein
MKRFRSTVPLLAAGLALACAVHAAPTQLSADAGEVRDIKYASGTGTTAMLYAATQGGGVFKSTDSGQTWTATALNTGYAWNIAISGSSIYAATENGLWKSTNAGVNWTHLTFDPARAVAVDPTTTTTVLLGVPGQGVFRSTDSGVNWTRQSSGLDSTNVLRIHYQSPGVAYVVLDCNSEDTVGTVEEGGWGGVFKTTNSNAATIAWTNFNNGGGATSLPSKCVHAITSQGTTVFVGLQDPLVASSSGNVTTGIFTTTGAGWTAPTFNNPNSGDLFGVESLAADRNSTGVNAGAIRVGVFSSQTAGGLYSQMVDPTAGIAPDVWTRIYATESIPSTPGVLLAAVKGLGIMRTAKLFVSTPTNDPFYWNPAVGIKADRVRGLANHANVAPNTYWMALYNGGVVKSTNAGSTWAEFDTGFDFGGAAGTPDPALIDAEAIAADPSNTSVVLVGTRGAGLFNLDAGGTGWVQTGVPASTRSVGVDVKPQSLLMPATNQVYYTLFDGPAGPAAGGLLTSLTGPSGLTQTLYPDGLTGCGPAASVATGSAHKVVQTAGSTAYLLRWDGLPYRSTNNFASATAGCVNAPSVGYERLAFFDIAQNPGNTSIVVGTTNKGIFYSLDGGANWTRASVTGLGSTTLSSIAYASGILYGVDRGGGFYCSADNGTTWKNANLGSLPRVSFREIRVLNGAIHILTDGGGVYTGFAATCP